MILILSDEYGSTNNVLNWLILFNAPFFRITSKSEIEIELIEIANDRYDIIIYNYERKINFSEISSVFIRKGEIHLKKSIQESSYTLECANILKNHLNYDRRILLDFLKHEIKLKHGIGDIDQQNVNKLIVLKKAKEAGLDIPNTYITKNTEDIKCLFSKHPNLITKSIGEMPIIKHKNNSYLYYTSNLKKSIDYKKLFLDYSLIQNNVNKLFEIRTFFLNDQTYSMAMFTQEDPKTSQDYRKYNEEFPNRVVPFNIPQTITFKIITLMHSLNLNSGSIDLIYTKENKYIFLEVNPVGQYGMIGYPTNINIDKLIAEYLIHCYDDK